MNNIIEHQGQVTFTAKSIFHPTANGFDSKQQQANSISHLTALKAQLHRDVMNVHSTSICMEEERQFLEEKRMMKRQASYQQMRKESAEKMDAIEYSWNFVFSAKESPLDIKNQIGNLESQYQILFSLKKNCMYDLQEQLYEKDDEYVLHLKKFESMIEQVVVTSNAAMKEIKSAYNIELANIEEAFESDRNKLLITSSSHIDQLEEQQQAVETHHIVALKSMYERNREAIDGAYDCKTEEYNALRDQLEDKIMEIESKVASSRRKYEAQVNYMDYELRVKTKENQSNIIKLRQQKHILTKYKDRLVHAREAFTETMTSNSKRIKALERQCRYAEGKADAIETQLRHFTDNDGYRFKSILKMHLDEIEEMMQRILQAERYIYEHVLGFRSPCPNETMGEMKKSITKVLTTVVTKEGLQCYGNADDEEARSLDCLLFNQLDLLLSKYKKDVDARMDKEKSIQTIKREIEDLEDELQKCIQSETSKNLLYPP